MSSELLALAAKFSQNMKLLICLSKSIEILKTAASSIVFIFFCHTFVSLLTAPSTEQQLYYIRLLKEK